MKKMKLLFLLLFLALITGCKQEYTLFISDSAITEQFEIILDNNEENLKRLNVDYYPLHANNNIVYKKKITENKNTIVATFNYSYKPYDFVNANSLNQCFKNRKLVIDDRKYYEIYLSDLNDCMYDYNLDINIVTNNKVVSNNADIVKKNKYIWHLTEENKDNFSIQLKIKKGTAKNASNNYQFITYIAIGIIVVVILVFALMFAKRRKNSNRI